MEDRSTDNGITFKIALANYLLFAKIAQRHI